MWEGGSEVAIHDHGVQESPYGWWLGPQVGFDVGAGMKACGRRGVLQGVGKWSVGWQERMVWVARKYVGVGSVGSSNGSICPHYWGE